MLSPRVGAAIAAPALILLASTLSTRSGGVESGNNSIPANASSQMPACQSCHSGSGPQAGRTNGPRIRLTAAFQALQPGQQVSVTTAVSGGVSGTDGGFICETSGGTFTTVGATRIITNPASITHSNDQNRTWTYTFNAPNTPGLVTMTAAGMSCNGSGSSGDEFSFSGYDTNAATATPLRLFVLPAGVVNQGTACSDGYENYSVLGANGPPTIGNQGFAFDLHGARPATLAFLVAGFNPVGFTPLDLGALFGLTGCRGYVGNVFFSLTGSTSAGVAERGEGTLSIPLPVPNSQVLLGVTLNVQSAYVDPSASALLGRGLPFTFSNGLAVTFQ